MSFILIFILILLNGFLALSEISLVLVNKARIELLISEKKKNAALVLKLTKDPEHFLSAIQLGITLIGIITGAIGGYTIVSDLKPIFVRFDLTNPYVEEFSLGIIVLTITYFSVLIGELVPKSIALRKAEKVALFVAPFIYYFSKILYPGVLFLSSSTKLMLSLVFKEPKKEQLISEEHLIMLLKQASKQGVLDNWEPEFHQKLFLFADIKARALLTPSEKIVWVDKNQTINQIKEKIQEIPHNNILVCENELNNLKGVFSLKKFFENYEKRNFHLDNIITPPIMISEDMTAIEILELFRERKEYFGIVVHDNSIKGTITLHDLAEGVFGNLPDIEEK